MIHPRRLSGKPGNIARYYTIGDYYTKGREEPSQWGGKLAAELGLSGTVDGQALQALLAGQAAGQTLGRHRADGMTEHHPGWDFAVNAPKSVSIMALVGGDQRIIAAHERAVDVALDYLEDHAGLRRRADGQIIFERTGRLVYARFTEHASRELDPHLHTHVVVMNITNREQDAPLASVESRTLYAEQRTAGQIYRNELAGAIRSLGYAIVQDPRTGLFEIDEVPKSLIADMSQRAEQIRAHAEGHGLSGQAAKRAAFYATRPRKAKVTDLPLEWHARAAEHLDRLTGARDRACGPDMVVPAERAVAGRAMLFGIRQSQAREAVADRGEMLRLALAGHVGEVRLQDILPFALAHEQSGKLLSTHNMTGDRVHIRGRTTRRTLRDERAIAHHLALSLDDARPATSAARLLETLPSAGLNPAQEQAVCQIGTSRDRLSAVHGIAGAGKSTMIRALVQASEAGRPYLALAPTSSAAANLGESAGVPSMTVAMFLARGGRDMSADHVLVVDEAGQLSNRQAVRLLDISQESGAKLIFLGDNKQTGAIEQGKAFWLMQQLGLPTAQLTESVRQQTRTMRSAVMTARAGDYTGSLHNLDKVVSGMNVEALAHHMVDEWAKLRPEQRAKTNLLVLDNATRLVVNSQVRETLKREGVVAAEDTRLQILGSAGMSEQEKQNARFYSAGQVVTFARDIAALGIAREAHYRVLGLGRERSGRPVVRLVDEHGREIRWDPRLGKASQINVFRAEDRVLAAGDRVQWRLVTPALGLRNAERGTVEQLDGTIAMIRWDREQRSQRIDLARHRTWDHGYAETVYSAQSKTYARAYVLAPVNAPLVNAKNYYTAITRARLGVKLWTEDPDRLIDVLNHRTGDKSSALEGLNRLDRDSLSTLLERYGDRIHIAKATADRARREQALLRKTHGRAASDPLSQWLGALAQRVADRIEQSVGLGAAGLPQQQDAVPPTQAPTQPTPARGPNRGFDR